MINRILMELYDDYAEGNLSSLVEFSEKTFPCDGTESFFIGCVLILFSRANGFKARYDCTREQLLSIVLSAKEKAGNSNLLEFYLDRINTQKGINKYFGKAIKDSKVEEYATIVIEYLEQFKPKFIDSIKKNDTKLNDYINAL